MGKYDHICELTGAENYPQWKKQMTLALQGEQLWSHCSSGRDPQDFADYASHIPKPADPAAVTDAEREQILDWLAKDAQAKGLIDRKISTTVASLLNEMQTTRGQWDALASHYACINILSEKLKDTEDVSHYIGVFKDARHRILQMEVSYTTEEFIFNLLQGLPDRVEWEIFHELTLSKLLLNSTSSS
ncbi:hypothetical protein OG21DRAFT_1516525, partial [Imleria badia]